MTDVKMLMTIIFIDILLIFGMFDFVRNVSANQCPFLKKQYKDIFKFQDDIQIERQDGDIITKEQSETETEMTTNTSALEDNELEEWSQDWVCANAENFANEFKEQGNWFQETWWNYQVQTCNAQKSFSGVVDSVVSTVKGFTETLSRPVSLFITTLSMMWNYPTCTMIPNELILIIFSPLVLGLIYISAKLIRGGG